MVSALTTPTLRRGDWIPMTFEEFLAWDVEGKTEWVNGKGVHFVPGSIRHERIFSFLFGLLRVFLDTTKSGEVLGSRTSLRIPSTNSAREPDLLVVLAEHRDRIKSTWVESPADFVVELLSNDSGARDLIDKRREYAAAGIPEYLLIDARDGGDEVMLLRLADDAYELVAPDQSGRLHSSVLTGFWIDSTWFAQDPLPSVPDVIQQLLSVSQ